MKAKQIIALGALLFIGGGVLLKNADKIDGAAADIAYVANGYERFTGNFRDLPQDTKMALHSATVLRWCQKDLTPNQIGGVEHTYDVALGILAKRSDTDKDASRNTINALDPAYRSSLRQRDGDSAEAKFCQDAKLRMEARG